MNSPHPSSEEIFRRLLDESSALLAATESHGIAIPDDELHREIIVPLLPAMLCDAAIRGHWREQHATGFVARIGRHIENGDPAPRWTPGDFEIHVTASYSAGPDARALADTLLSEDSLREMTATLMNQLLDALWPTLAPTPISPQAEPEVEITPAEIPAPIVPPEPMPATETPSAMPSPSRALIRTLCRKLSASSVLRGVAKNSAPRDAGAAIVARRILAIAALPTPRHHTNRIRKRRSS